jgi:hypothetical protein
MGLYREFLLILVGGAIGAALGAGFGALVGFVSPEFINALVHPFAIQAHDRAGAAMGMISGLLIGAAAMAVGRFIGAIRIWAAGGCSGRYDRAEPGAQSDRSGVS